MCKNDNFEYYNIISKELDDSYVKNFFIKNSIIEVLKKIEAQIKII